MSKITTLAEYATIQGGYAYKSTDFLKTGKFKVLKIKNIRFGYIDYSETDFISDQLSKKTEEWKTKPKDILISMTGSGPNAPASLVGRVARVGENEPISFINQRIGRVIVNEKVDSDYIYYLLSQKSSQEYFVNNSTGSANQVNINGNTILSLEVPCISFEESKKIAQILNAFDDKIQLNTQINQTLEQIAQALFKSWFVDFDPVRAKVQALSDGMSLEQAELAAMQAISGKTPEELTALSQTQPERYAELAETAKAFPYEIVEVDGVEVPKGWEYKPADELFDIGIGKTPPRKETEWFSTNPDDMQWISIKDMGNSGVFITESSEFLTNQAVDKFNIRKIPENTILLSFKLTIGRVSITTCETTTNEAIAHFKITDKSFLTTEYLYLFFQQFDFNSLGSTSSIATAVNSKTIKGIEILIPNEELIKAFQMKISNIFAQIKNLTMENKNLVETRDLLLPKLLNWGIL